MLWSLIILSFLSLDRSSALHIGKIYNASLGTDLFNLTINASTCEECLCLMMNSTSTDFIQSFNCLTSEINDVNCELFTNATYFNSSFYQMIAQLNSTFYFQQLPSINPTETRTSKGMNFFS